MVYVVAILTVADPLAFAEFEGKAISILRSHGGELVTAFEPAMLSDQASSEEDALQEVHCLKFPDQGAFERYRKDPALLAMADLRKKAISATQVYVSDTLKDYG